MPKARGRLLVPRVEFVERESSRERKDSCTSKERELHKKKIILLTREGKYKYRLRRDLKGPLQRLDFLVVGVLSQRLEISRWELMSAC